MNLKIVFEDTHLLVCYKPAGVPVQSARVGTRDCESILKNYLYEKNPQKGAPYLGLIHRLDQPVEGLLVFAKTEEAAAGLSRQLQDGRMKKSYLAVRRAVDKSTKSSSKSVEDCGKTVKNVENSVENWIEITDYLRKNGRENRSEIVKAGTSGAKKAVLSYRILEAADGRELAEIRLLTGRHHQIRVQMAGRGTPLIGDQKYGAVSENVDIVDKLYPALCAYRLEFLHPKTGKSLTFQIKPENPVFAPFHSG
ncbi:MAG: RNA pseudouridine synthase [Lachnospiraceae bacterium]|jgi:23S rRNA pseudouridine1911/1915/1917 synthase|nr:RNA pseudouridine synthase [Lachnospiraceae bacterium]